MSIDLKKQGKWHWAKVEVIIRHGEMMLKMEKGEDASNKAISLEAEAALRKSRKI